MVQLFGLRDPGGAKCAGTWTVSTARVMAVSESFFEPLCSWRSEGLLGQSFSIVPHAQALRGLPCLGALCCSGHQGRRGTPPAGVLLCSSVRQTFDGPASLLFSYRCWRVGKEAVVMAPPPLQYSAVLPCFHGCLAFLHQNLPPRSLPSHPLSPSLCSQQQPSPWDCSTIPNLQLPAAAPSRRSVFLPRVYMAAARTV